MADIWNENNYATLTPQQRRAVESRKGTEETAVEYLNRIGAGVSAVDSYVEADKAAYRDALTGAAAGLFEAGLDAEEMLGRALKFAVATTTVQRQVDELLAPFAEAAATAQASFSAE